MATPGVIIQLLGFPGTGKYTVGRAVVDALEAEGRTARLVDNHSTANVILSLVPRAVSGIPTDVRDRIFEVRAAVLTTIEALSPPDWSFVFTNFLPPDTPPGVLDRHRAVAEARGARFLPVLLQCDPDEVLRRVTAPGRNARLKLVDVDRARVVLGLGMAMPDWPDIRTLDVTHLAPPDAAHAIIDMLRPGGADAAS